MADLTQEQMLEMALIAGISIPHNAVAHLTTRLNALPEAPQVLNQYPAGGIESRT